MRWLPSTLLVALSACELLGGPPADAGALLDGGPQADGGGLDASLPPLELDFIPVPLPAQALRLGLVSDGTTLYAATATSALQSFIAASEDEGATWQVRSAPAPNLLVPSPDGGLYALSSQALRRSTDGARTFTPLTTPPSIRLAEAPHVDTTADGALWLANRAPPLALERSRDDGATFTAIALPADTTRLEPCELRGGRFVALRNGGEVVASAGDTLQSLGTLGTATGPVFCLETQAGTVLVSGTFSTGLELHRLPAGATTWERTAPGIAFRLTSSGGTLFRWLSGGRLDVSTDEGATWTTRTASLPNGLVLGDLALVGDTPNAHAAGVNLRLPPGAAEWELRIEPGLPSASVGAVDLAFAVESPAAALLVEDNVQRTLYVAEDGLTWRRGRTLPRGAATALALSPDGTQALLGALDGTYRVYADAGTTTVIDDRIETAAGLRDTNPIRQAVWDRAQGSFIVVTTGNDAATAGSVWQLNPDTGNRTWTEERPYTTTTAPAVRLGAYGALCVSAPAPGSGLPRSMLVSLRSNVSANSFLNYLLTKQPLFDFSGWWLQDTPPVGFSGALAAACNGAWGKGVAVLWPERRLWVGPFADRLREVPLPAGMAEPRVVRFDGQGRLWLATAAGLWRTTTPLSLP